MTKPVRSVTLGGTKKVTPWVKVEGTCFLCNEPFEVVLPRDAYLRWVGGMKIQEAWQGKGATTNNRELLISSAHGDCIDDLLDFDDEKGEMYNGLD